MTVTLGATPRNMWQGLSGDAKPNNSNHVVITNDLFFETDTGTFYIFNGTSWALYDSSGNLSSHVIPVSPFDYGGIGSGTADDTEPFQKAANFAKSRGVPLDTSGGIWAIENVTVSNAVSFIIQGSGTIKQKNTDGLPGIGQALIVSDVTYFGFFETAVDGNPGNCKQGSSGHPTIEWNTTVATQGRQDFVVDFKPRSFDGNNGWGQFECYVYESAGSTFTKAARITCQVGRSTSHGNNGSAFKVRGAAAMVAYLDPDVQNDDQFGFEAKGLPTGPGSPGFAFNVSAEVGFGHYIDFVYMRGGHFFRTIGAPFLQMVLNAECCDYIHEEDCINPYWDQTPQSFTNTTGVGGVITVASIPSGFGDKSVATFANTGGAPPAPLVAGARYFVRDRSGLTFRVAATDGGTAITLTDTGSGTNTLQFLGITYSTTTKLDDCLYLVANPGTIVLGPKMYHSSYHTAHRNMSMEETTLNTCGKVRLVNGSFNRNVTIANGDPRVQHEIEAEFRQGWATNVSFGSQTLLLASGKFDNCLWDVGQSFNLSRDTIVSNSRFLGGAATVFSAPLNFTMVDNQWNLNDTSTSRCEIAPPATGTSVTVNLIRNRIPRNATQVTQRRINAGGDLNYLDLYEDDNDFSTDTVTGQALSTSLRLSGKRNRNGYRADSDYPYITLANSATPSIIGGGVFQTGGVTAITNFLNGIDYTKITVYVNAGHQINFTANIVTQNAANIPGPAIREFRMLGGVWYEGSACPSPSSSVTGATFTASSTEPRFIATETDAGTDLKTWDFDVNAGILTGRTRTDADGAGVNWLSVIRGATTAIASVNWGNATNNPAGNWLGTGLFTFGGNITYASSTSSSTSPGRKWIETDQGADLKRWITDVNGAVWKLRTLTDADATGKDILSVARGATTAIASLTYGNSTDLPPHIFNGDIKINVAGNGLYVKEGSNATMGVVTLVAGTAVVSTTKVTANSRVILTAQSLGTVTVGQGLAVSARTAGTSFTIISTTPTDTSVVAWMIVEPA